MSLVSYTIVSRYTPQQRDPLPQDLEGGADPWQIEPPLGLAQRLHSRPAPSFIPASLEYDEYGMPNLGADIQSTRAVTNDNSQDVSAWYRSLTTRGRVKCEEQLSMATLLCSPPAVPSSSFSSQPWIGNKHPSNSDVDPAYRHNWFRSHPLQSDATHSSKPSTLADLLERNPPPLPSEPAFSPPVFLSIGPSNKGFTMLQRQGWQEGEGLGSARGERKLREGLGMKRTLETVFLEREVEQRRPMSARTGRSPSLVDGVKQEVIDLTLSDSERHSMQEVVDLTLSDSDSEDDHPVDPTPEGIHSNSTPHGTTLLTPIPTTLKADRLGIGLKARRNSSLKVKAITHTSAALAYHIRSGNKSRKDKARHGRGSRGFARARRKEEQERVGLLAYMNS